MKAGFLKLILCFGFLNNALSQQLEDLDFSSNGGFSISDFENIALEYLRFNFEIASALTIGEELAILKNITDDPGRSTIPSSSPLPEDENENGLYIGSSAGSSFGMGQMLAIVNEINSTIPVTTVAFDNALKQASEYLTEMYQLLLTTMSQDRELFTRTQIFTPVNLTKSVLEELNATIIPTPFNETDVSSFINAQISSLSNQSGLNQPYIPEGMSVPVSTKAMLVHTLLLSDKWELPRRSVGKAVFNNETEVDMLEFVGNFPYLESDRAIEVSIPIKEDGSRILSLILPRTIEDAIMGQLGTAENGTAKTVRVRIPMFNFTFRVPHDGGVGSSRCDFQKQPNFLNVLDDVTYVNFSSDGISAVSITGIQINEVGSYKEELKSQQKEESATTEESPEMTTIVPDMVSSSSTKKSVTKRNAEADLKETKTAKSKGDEKLIVFDQPFTWTVIDDKVFSVPVFSGAIESFPGAVDLTERLRPAGRNKVFGLDGSLRYLNCL